MRFNYYLLGEILKERRIEKGLSKNKLAQYVGISQPEVTRVHLPHFEQKYSQVSHILLSLFSLKSSCLSSSSCSSTSIIILECTLEWYHYTRT